MRTPASPARPAALAGLALVAALAVSGCSSDDTDPAGSPTFQAPSSSPSDDPTPSGPASSAAPSSAPPASNLPAACEAITGGDIAKMMGVSVGAGKAERGDDDDAGVAWTTSECSFEAPGEVEVTVKLTGPADVTKGSFGCPQPSDSDGNVEPADDVAGATKGWWRTNSAPPLEAVLRACSAEANVDVDLDYEINDYEGDPRQQAADLAAFVLANIQG